MVSQNVTIKTPDKTGRDLHNLKQNNKIVTDTIEQTNIYNGQFQSVQLQKPFESGPVGPNEPARYS